VKTNIILQVKSVHISEDKHHLTSQVSTYKWRQTSSYKSSQYISQVSTYKWRQTSSYKSSQYISEDKYHLTVKSVHKWRQISSYKSVDKLHLTSQYISYIST